MNQEAKFQKVIIFLKIKISLKSAFLKKKIDINYFYQTVSFYESNKDFLPINDRVYKRDNGILQFYDNGCYRGMHKDLMHPSPKIQGSRGIIYFDNSNNFYADSFEGTSSGRNTSMHLQKYRIRIKGDTLYFLEERILSGKVCTIFVKKDSIPKKYKEYKANW